MGGQRAGGPFTGRWGSQGSLGQLGFAEPPLTLGPREDMAPLDLARVLLGCLSFLDVQLKINSPSGIVWGQALLPSAIIKE